MPTQLTTRLGDPNSVPYFLWDAPMTVSELRFRLQSGSAAERDRLLGKILREARDTDVWLFTTPQEVSARWPTLLPHLGRRRLFWEFLLNLWRKEGLIE